MLSKILVAIDIRETNQTVFEEALSLAKVTGAELMLLNVIAPDSTNYPNPFIYSGYDYNLMDESLVTIYQREWDKFKQRGMNILRSLAQAAAAAGVDVEYIQDFGNPGFTICDRAQSWSADLILIGSRGLTGIQEIFLGSVSNYVTHHAPCSVLILRLAGASDSEIVSDKSVESTANAPNALQ